MITIDKSYKGLSIDGHANFAEQGKDIVCAAVSVLAQTLIASIEELTDDDVRSVIEHGHIELNYRNLSEMSRVLIDSFLIGCRMLESEYPECVTLAEH